jgi:putative nucleotidyltransferase with HDIG domain
LFLLFSSVGLAALLTERMAFHYAWAPWLVAALALLLAGFASLAVTLRLARQSRAFATAMATRSLQQAEHVAQTLRGTPYVEAARQWKSSLRAMQASLDERQTEAQGRHTALVQLMGMFASAVDERATYLRGHSERVSLYAAEIAREMKLDSGEVERIRLAALVHDIGNLGVDDAIISKNAPLSPEEFEIVKSHTVKGASILRPIEALTDLIPGIELHHEALDGTGYPYGLGEHEIPVMARIIAVADSFDAMTNARPYQSAMDPLYVLEVLDRMAGSRYDPAVVQALDTLVKRGTIVVKSLRAAASFPRRRQATETL